jgi:hypothetical protein
MNSENSDGRYFRQFLEFERAFNRSKKIPECVFDNFLVSSYMAAAAAAEGAVQ